MPPSGPPSQPPGRVSSLFAWREVLRAGWLQGAVDGSAVGVLYQLAALASAAVW